MRTLLAVSVLALATACASTTTEPTEPVIVDTPEVVDVIPTPFELTMKTVDDLLVAGNEQAAILRLEQLIGMQEATDEERGAALFRMGKLQYGEGNDLAGAIASFDELMTTYPESELVSDAAELRTLASGEQTSLKALLDTSEDMSRTERFETLFRLGQHQDAADLMLDQNLSPDNAYILDMYQIGYLCDDETLTGPSYDLTEPDGTARTLHFCEFGK